ncbi:hypothetical protein GXW82_13650 [Streptacidiphilus sp. 4-A2]|nr:hypothetical protein [Streptacidiphilus sp. 4-A2]
MSLDVPLGQESLTMIGLRIGPAGWRETVRHPGTGADLRRLPLALGVVAARAESTESLDTLVSALREEDSQLDALSARSRISIYGLSSTSYAELPPEAARLFRLLGLHPGPEIDVHACGALLDAALPVRSLLDTLVGAHLVVERIPGRFVLHDLLRAYAAEVADREESVQERRAALERLSAHYLSIAESADRFLGPMAMMSARTTEQTWTWPGPQITSYESALAWFDSELSTLVGILRAAAEQGLEPYAWRKRRRVPFSHGDLVTGRSGRRSTASRSTRRPVGTTSRPVRPRSGNSATHSPAWDVRMRRSRLCTPP